MEWIAGIEPAAAYRRGRKIGGTSSQGGEHCGVGAAVR
jgi:hypothetical protein